MRNSSSHTTERPIALFWQRVRHVAHRVADVQARLLLSLLYVLFIIPVGLFIRINDDPLDLRRQAQRDSHWQQRPQVDSDLRAARRQF
jgi:hypothetical protein